MSVHSTSLKKKTEGSILQQIEKSRSIPQSLPINRINGVTLPPPQPHLQPTTSPHPPPAPTPPQPHRFKQYFGEIYVDDDVKAST